MHDKVVLVTIAAVIEFNWEFAIADCPSSALSYFEGIDPVSRLDNSNPVFLARICIDSFRKCMLDLLVGRNRFSIALILSCFLVLNLNVVIQEKFFYP